LLVKFAPPGTIDPARVPSKKPPFLDMFVDDRGNLWVQPAAVAADQGRVWDVFNAEGRLLGQLRSPFSLARMGFFGPHPCIRGTRIYAVTPDQDGNPTVVIGHIERPDHGFRR
jgi:hypothetical protein